MKLGYRDPAVGEERPRRVLEWESGTTLDLLPVKHALFDLAAFAVSLSVALTQDGALSFVAIAFAVLTGFTSAVYLLGFAVGFGVHRIVKPGPQETHGPHDGRHRARRWSESLLDRRNQDQAAVHRGARPPRKGRRAGP